MSNLVGFVDSMLIKCSSNWPYSYFLFNTEIITSRKSFVSLTNFQRAQYGR